MQQQTTKYPETAVILTQIWKFSVHLGKILRPKKNQAYIYAKNYDDFYSFRLYSFTFRLLSQ